MGRVYCSADWHGNKTAFQVFDFLQPDDVLYFLGDSTDRGEYGIELFTLLMNDPRVIMIKGNHDEFLEDGIKAINYDEAECEGLPQPGDRSKFDLSLWAYNGGEFTYDKVWQLTKEERLAILKCIKEMPLQKTYYSKKTGNTIILEHAGYSPFVPPHRSHDPLWDRQHFYDAWNEGWAIKGRNPDKTYIVHGHTPVQYLQFERGYIDKEPLTKEELKYKEEFEYDLPTEYKPTILKYCGGHKIDIDMCSITSNRIALLDLDTFEEIYFDRKEEE